MSAVNYQMEFIYVNFVKFLKDKSIVCITNMYSSFNVKEISILYLDSVNVDLHN